jgi:GLPGLI family protein
MRKYLLIDLLIFLFSNSLLAQKIISEGTIHYNISIQNADKQKEVIDSATSTIYLKGELSRIDMINSMGSETTIHDSKDAGAVILKQYSGQKLMITLTKQNWVDKNKKYEGLIFQTTIETKTIAGYICKKAIARLNNGTSFIVYYTPDLNIFNKEYDPMFKNLFGLPVQYEFAIGKLTFQYTVSVIDLNPVSSSKFETPKSGYRIITYDENQQKKNESQ